MTNDIKNQDLKYRPLVYVASAYSGDVITNIEKSQAVLQVLFGTGTDTAGTASDVPTFHE